MERRTQPGYEYHSCDFMDDGVYMDMNLLREYEDTGLTPEQIRGLKERDTAREPRMIYENNCLKAYTCPNCNLTLIYKDASGWNGKYCSYCSGCGQRLKWEE